MPYHKPKQVKLTLDIIIHIHQIPDTADIVRNIRIAADRMLDYAAGNRKIHRQLKDDAELWRVLEENFGFVL